MRRVVIFAGAGSSAAVDPKTFPTTAAFFEGLPADVTGDRLFAHIKQLAETRLKGAPVDIEHILWDLVGLKGFMTLIGDETTAAGWFLKENRFGDLGLSSGLYFSEILKIRDGVLRMIGELSSRINRHVYELHGTRPLRKDIDRTWAPLLEGLSHDSVLNIFTTNYDVILEDAIRVAGLSLQTGRTQDQWPTLQTNLWTRTSDGVGLLTKLHGSVDWTRSQAGGIYVGAPGFRGDHSQHVIIYPGFKGEPIDEPFRSFHLHFESALASADIAIFVGYAFRDDYVNSVIQRTLKPNTSVVSINPDSSIERVPPLKERAHQVKQPFGLDATKACLRHLKKA